MIKEAEIPSRLVFESVIVTQGAISCARSKVVLPHKTFETPAMVIQQLSRPICDTSSLDQDSDMLEPSERCEEGF